VFLYFDLMQMRVLPSVQPFHAIAYPIDAMLALEIRYMSSELREMQIALSNVFFVSSYLQNAPAVLHEREIC
jgi:hypothetical protein